MCAVVRYPRPGLTVDSAIVAPPSREGESAHLLLIKRGKPPCKASSCHCLQRRKQPLDPADTWIHTQDAWALPGGFVDEDEPLQRAAERELKEETSLDAKDLLFTQVSQSRPPERSASPQAKAGLKHTALLQVGAFGDPGRDPRGWTISVAYAAVVPSTDASTKAGVQGLCLALMLLCTSA